MKTKYVSRVVAAALMLALNPTSSVAGENHGHGGHNHSKHDHSNHGPVHGGQFIEDANHHGVEMVAKENEVAFFMTVEGKPLDVSGSQFKAIIQTEAGTKMIALNSDGAMLTATLESPLVKGDKVVVTGKDSHGDTIQARFVKD